MDAVADIATMRGNYDDAEVALQQAILGWRVVGAAAVSGGLTVRLANVYALQGRTQQADAWFDEAIAAAERQRIVSFRNPTNAGLGGFYGLGVGRITNDD